VHDLPVDFGRRAVFAGDAGLDSGGLRHPDTVADDGPGRGLVGGEEADRAKTRVVGLQARDHRVRGAHGGEAGAVDVQRQDAGDLGPDRRGRQRFRARAARAAWAGAPSALDGAVSVHYGGAAVSALPLADGGADDGAAVIGGESQPQHPVARVFVGGGREAVKEADARGERERPLRREGEARHGHCLRDVPLAAGRPRHHRTLATAASSCTTETPHQEERRELPPSRQPSARPRLADRPASAEGEGVAGPARSASAKTT
jgi:hypothetical protein